MPGQNETERFVQLLIGCQDRISAYIGMLLGNPKFVDDVLQETNLVLWRKADEFDHDRDFAAWACGIARFQVLAYIRDAKRDRHLFDESLVVSLASAAGATLAEFDTHSTALGGCLDKLTCDQKRLLDSRYANDESIGEIAAGSGRTATSIAKQLSRIRQMLLDCVQRRLAEEATA